MGLLQDMNQAFTAVGCKNFADIVEPGLQLLTMEFLMSLTVEETSTETKVYFRFFNEQFKMTLQQFSVTLGFNKRCNLDPNTLAQCYEYDHSSWWSLISKEPVSSKNSIVSIHNPTLRFLAKWFAMVVHSRTNLRLCSLPDLQCLYAMANKIRFSPVRSILAHWQKIILGRSPIEITPLVTRVARYVKTMEGAEVTFLPETGVQIRGQSRAFCARAHDAGGTRELYLYVLSRV